MTVTVALAGATGNLGPSILKALLEASFQVIILSRQGSNSTDSLATHPNQKVVNVDYSDIDNLKSALKGVDVVVSTLAYNNVSLLIDACVAAGVKRFIASEFGSDTQHPLSRKLPIYVGKTGTSDYLGKVALSNPDFSYTLPINNLFLDWGLKVGFILNVKEHKGIIYDGGDVPASMTRLQTVGKAVVGIVNNLDATKNRAVYYHDGVFTQNELIGLVKEIDGKEWTLEQASTAELEKKALEDISKGEKPVMVNFIYRAALSKEHNPDYSAKVDNELLGLEVMKKEEVVEMLKTLL